MSNNFEKLVQNVQNGEMYSVKFKNDSQVYMGIPMIPGRYQNDDPAKFVLKVELPKEKKGVFEFLVDDIELLEKSS